MNFILYYKTVSCGDIALRTSWKPSITVTSSRRQKTTRIFSTRSSFAILYQQALVGWKLLSSPNLSQRPDDSRNDQVLQSILPEIIHKEKGKSRRYHTTQHGIPSSYQFLIDYWNMISSTATKAKRTSISHTYPNTYWSNTRWFLARGRGRRFTQSRSAILKACSTRRTISSGYQGRTLAIVNRCLPTFNNAITLKLVRDWYENAEKRTHPRMIAAVVARFARLLCWLSSYRSVSSTISSDRISFQIE